MTTETFVKDIKPGLKNLNLIFIVLETGAYAAVAGSRGVGCGREEEHIACVNLLPGQQGAPHSIARSPSQILTEGVAVG